MAIQLSTSISVNVSGNILFIRNGARCLQRKSWQKYDKSMPDAFRLLLLSLQGLNQTKAVNILCIFTKRSKETAVSNSDSELTENIPVENLCSLCIPVWHHNGSRAFYGSGCGTTIVINNKLLQRDLETRLVIAQCFMCQKKKYLGIMWSAT